MKATILFKQKRIVKICNKKVLNSRKYNVVVYWCGGVSNVN